MWEARMQFALRRIVWTLTWLGICCQIFGCSYLNVNRVEGPGADSTFNGITSLLGDSSLSLVSILVVHGFGTHPPGYSQHLQERITRELEMTGHCGDAQPIIGGTYGSITVCRYQRGDGRQLRVYELSWSSLTEGLKKHYLGEDH